MPYALLSSDSNCPSEVLLHAVRWMLLVLEATTSQIPREGGEDNFWIVREGGQWNTMFDVQCQHFWWCNKQVPVHMEVPIGSLLQGMMVSVMKWHEMPYCQTVA
jgi:hypothetical protein